MVDIAYAQTLYDRTRGVFASNFRGDVGEVEQLSTRCRLARGTYSNKVHSCLLR